ncbi:MAG: hypothetical protein WBM17_17285 [Anaerolineales bacterium]
MLRVEIRIKGHLDEKWAEWLAGFTLKLTGQDETTLEGTVEDQAALYGLIGKLRDLGVKLTAVHVGEDKDDFLEEDGRLE